MKTLTKSVGLVATTR